MPPPELEPLGGRQPIPGTQPPMRGSRLPIGRRYVDPLVRPLIERGLVYRTGRATYDFALPMFRSYIRRRRKLTDLTGSVRGGVAATADGGRHRND